MEISTNNVANHINHETEKGRTESFVGEGYRTSVYPIPVVPLLIDDTQPLEGARQLLRVIRPHWRDEDIQFTVFTAGYTNKLIGCSVHQSDTVLVRIYGRRTDLMIDRNQERNSMVVLNTIGCAAPVFCRFDNGIAYGFQPGVVLDIKMARRPIIQRLIARELVRMHSADTVAIATQFGNGLHFDTSPSLFPTLYKWLEHVPDAFPDANKQARLDEDGVCKEYLKTEIDSLYSVLTTLQSPVVFCHNDLLLKNIVYNEHKQKVNFIDFEYVAYNYQAFDIANHFCEYAGMEVVDFNLYPDREYQLGWLRGFLEEQSIQDGRQHDCSQQNGVQDGRHSPQVTDTDVERLYVQVQKFSLACHLFWSLWAIIQARFSTIDYDYIDFACQRLTEYRRRKEEFLQLELP